MTKYQKYFEEMLAQNKELFTEFKEIHDKFDADPDVWRETFNQQGQEVLDVIRRYENRLCGHSESSGYSKFTTNLADKFQEKVKEFFPRINAVGSL
jgi:hypothetical protein